MSLLTCFVLFVTGRAGACISVRTLATRKRKADLVGLKSDTIEFGEEENFVEAEQFAYKAWKRYEVWGCTRCAATRTAHIVRYASRAVTAWAAFRDRPSRRSRTR